MKTIRRRWGLRFAGVFLLCSTLSAEELRFPVRHDHAIGSCRGELIFGEAGVEYRAADKKHARFWKYEDIQQAGLLGPKKITILTYEDSTWKLGKDRVYRFEVLEGEIGPSVWSLLQAKVTRPLVLAIIPPGIETKFEIPAKHLRGFGGTDGSLEFSDRYLVYRTASPQDSRVWRYEDLSSIGTTGPYQLRVTAMDRADGEFGEERNFVFSLKRALAPEIYDFVWWKVNGPRISSAPRR